jgi:rod shape-determining protein MreD
MSPSWPYYFLFVVCSLAVAFLVAVYPLPMNWSVYRPELVCVVIIYWVLHKPYNIGVGIAWCVGLVQDIVEDAVWGAHALALAVVAYICLMSYRRLRSYSLGQQSVWVFVFVGIHQLMVNWIQSLSGYGSPVWYLSVSALITAFCWPFLVIALDRLQRFYRLF